MKIPIPMNPDQEYQHAKSKVSCSRAFRDPRYGDGGRSSAIASDPDAAAAATPVAAAGTPSDKYFVSEQSAAHELHAAPAGDEQRAQPPS